jgi:hypothetical protein
MRSTRSAAHRRVDEIASDHGWARPVAERAYHGAVTSKQRLLQLVERLPDEQVDELLRLATDLYADPGQRPPVPAFVGIGDSGRNDVSQRADEFLRDGFGR